MFSSYLGAGLGDILQQIINSFMNQEDPSEQIKKAQRISLRSDGTVEEPAEVPSAPQKSSGFDFSSLTGLFGGLLGGGDRSKRGRASRRATFTE